MKQNIDFYFIKYVQSGIMDVSKMWKIDFVAVGLLQFSTNNGETSTLEDNIPLDAIDSHNTAGTADNAGNSTLSQGHQLLTLVKFLNAQK